MYQLVSHRIFNKIISLQLFLKFNYLDPMNPDTLIHLLTDTRRFIRHLGPVEGNTPLTGHNRVLSKLTRDVVYHMYFLLLESYPDATLSHRSAFEAEFKALIDTIHNQFYTRQIGSYFSVRK